MLQYKMYSHFTSSLALNKCNILVWQQICIVCISGVWWHIECWRQTFCMYVAGSLYFIGLVRYIICRLRTITFCMCLLARCRWTWRCTARCGSSWVGTCSGQTPEPCPCSSGHQSSYTRPPPRSINGGQTSSCDIISVDRHTRISYPQQLPIS